MDENHLAEQTTVKDSTISFMVNGERVTAALSPALRLVDILRDKLMLTGTKLSCGIGRCGACSVLMNGRLVNSCLVLAYQIEGASLTTIEGLGRGRDGLHPIQEAFLEEGGFQCGYCTSGMVMAVKSLLDETPQPSQEQVREALSGNICRCTGYGGILRAVDRASCRARM
ncbi:(2Fe-2S)-binding protein [Mesobacillus foraminis]|uniref:(2Fe-2S)-binding protein n=1 Tax=Mesobacillus foraminis TaxID=279826 RepID=UPI001BE833DF|nr:(2Fe-2S)-binding protein [Mesobacillus foraminis]MBT2754535.1 (2Fe-2S)-binding protein [Mesobacillus foraminis]